MKKYETRVEDKPRSYEVLVERTCDLCGFKARNENWGEGYYDVNETECRVEVRWKGGSNFPEGGYGTAIEIDICPVCFKEKLVPWLRSQGAKIEEKDWDW